MKSAATSTPPVSLRRKSDPPGWLRRVCSGLPGVTEVEGWGHPNFRTSGGTFAVFEIYKGRPCIAIRADPEEQRFLVQRFGFFRSPYVGNRGWVSVWVDEPAPYRLMRDLIVLGHGRSREKPARTARRTRSRAPSAPRRPRPQR